VKLYQSPKLPGHYVAVAADGTRFLVPVEPIGPEAWRGRKPYRGRYKLTEVPEVVVASYRVYHWEAEHAW
jgi:hypothetical protein